jgi:cytochrome c-type biogenesis protein CcmH/NrfF
MQVIRDELRKGKSDKEIYTKLTTEYGETILYSPAFDAQSAILWLLPVLQLLCTHPGLLSFCMGEAQGHKKMVPIFLFDLLE